MNDYAGAVESLIQRINESVLLPDRRDALFQLRDLLCDNSKAQMAFGGIGFPSLCTVLREHRSEADMVRAALEAMSHAVSQDGRANAQVGRPRNLHPLRADATYTHGRDCTSFLDLQDSQVGAVNAEQLARTPDSFTLLLSLLDDEVGVQDFYARYHTLQILKALLLANPKLLQEVGC